MSLIPTSTVTLARALRARLEAELPARVEAVGLPPVREFLSHDPARPQPTAAPQVWVVVTSARPVSPAGFGGANAQHTRSRELQVGISCAGEDADVAQERLYAYVDLVLEALLGDPSVGGAAADLRWTGEEYTPNQAHGTTALFKIGTLAFSATRWTTLGVD
jgi:hypothetical protein